jgi:hypothetical protein
MAVVRVSATLAARHVLAGPTSLRLDNSSMTLIANEKQHGR